MVLTRKSSAWHVGTISIQLVPAQHDDLGNYVDTQPQASNKTQDSPPVHIWSGKRLSKPNPLDQFTKSVLPRLFFLMRTRTRTLGANFNEQEGF